MDLSKIKIDSAKVARGDWVGELPFSGMEGLRLKVRGLGSAVYRDTLAKRGRAVPRSSRNRDGSMPIAIADRVTGEALAEAVLLDWEGLSDSGCVEPYDKELAMKLLTDPDFAAFREAVIYAASIVAEDDRDQEDNLLGNSGPPSAGG